MDATDRIRAENKKPYVRGFKGFPKGSIAEAGAKAEHERLMAESQAAHPDPFEGLVDKK